LDTPNERAIPVRTAVAAWVMLFIAGCGSGTHHSTTGNPLGSTPPPIAAPPPPPSFPPPPPANPPSTPPTTPPTTPPATSVTVSGVVTFDRVPFSGTANAGLNFGATTQAPVRGATVEAIAAVGGAVLATTQTSATGTYSLPNLPVSTQVFLRVKAELVKSGTPAWTVRVRDNTSAGALYALDGAAFDSGTVATLTRDLNAPSGWSTSAGAYTATRSAAPFALLDVAYQSMQLVLTANASTVFPDLAFFWSPANVPVQGDVTIGEIETTLFELPGGGVPPAIYVLGAADVDTDEFDTHVIAHEWGHYYQWAFSRDDSMGGFHDPLEQLDLRVAFSEGWSDAFSGMATADPLYRDSFDVDQAMSFDANLDTGTVTDRGWYSEGSIALLLYDVFDGGAGDDDALQIGFGPIHTAMQSLATTQAFTGIHPFLRRLLTSAPAQAVAITTLATQHDIVAVQADDFAPTETNDGGGTIDLPIYTAIGPGQTRNVCSTGAPGQTYNKLGNISLMSITLMGAYSGTVTVISDPDPDADADIVIYEDGVEVTRSEDLGDESFTLSLPAGTYTVEVFDSSNVYADFTGFPPLGDTCIDVTMAP
jgi:hypothetical protein